MKNRNRRKLKLTSFGKLLLILLLGLILFGVYKFLDKEEPVDNKPIINGYTDLNGKKEDNPQVINKEPVSSLIDVVETEESDKDVIKKTFANGMNSSAFKELIDRKRNFIKKSDSYKKSSYNFDKMLHYSDIEKNLMNLNNSDIVKLELIGTSVDNRSIYGIEVGKGDKVVFLDANVHAAEIANVLMLLKYLNEVVDLYENRNSKIIDCLNEYTIAAIPSINPDGYEIYNYGVEALNNKDLWWYKNRNKYDFENMKSNANGVDINRNFPTQNAGLYFKQYNLIKSVSLEKTTSNTAYFGGTSLGSEPETKAAMYFMLNYYKNTVKYINMHSQGRVIYAGKPNLASEFNTLTKNFANSVSKINGYKVHGLSAEEVGEGNDGSATDFMAELANGFAFSTKTGRLTANKHINPYVELVNPYPVITMETARVYRRDPQIFKTEYYDKKIRNVLFDLIGYSL